MAEPSGPTLFTIPITTTGGAFVCTVPAPGIYLLTFTSPPDNRLTTAFNSAFITALDTLDAHFPPGVLVTTSGIPKFYSNGLDLVHVVATKTFFDDSFYPLLHRILTYPMPTIALLNGHAFAGGLIIAMHHDYRIQNPSKGYLCMNEVHFGALLDGPLATIFREKCSPQTFRATCLEGRRFNAPDALASGLVDALGTWSDVGPFVATRGLVTLGWSGAYGGLKEEMYKGCLAVLRSAAAVRDWRRDIEGWKASEKMSFGRSVMGVKYNVEEANKIRSAYEKLKAKM